MRTSATELNRLKGHKALLMNKINVEIVILMEPHNNLGDLLYKTTEGL